MKKKLDIVPLSEWEFNALSQQVQPVVDVQWMHEYTWHRRDNERDFKHHYEALQLSQALGIAKQVAYRIEAIVDLYHNDQAEYVAAIMHAEFGYTGACFRVDNHVTMHRTFTYAREARKQGLEYIPVDAYGQPIPLPCLRRMYMIEQRGHHPDVYWVAKGTKQTVLSASFGHWMVAIAAWESGGWDVPYLEFSRTL